jgi:hypothetical protein
MPQEKSWDEVNKTFCTPCAITNTIIALACLPVAILLTYFYSVPDLVVLKVGAWVIGSLAGAWSVVLWGKIGLHKLLCAKK